MATQSRRRPRGFSLLEMLVAITILGFALAALYQAASAATRNLRTTQRHAYAVELARSLVDEYAVLPSRSAMEMRGETGSGFRWRVGATPLPAYGEALPSGALQRLQVEVAWPDGPRLRSVQLHSVATGIEP